MATSSQQAEFFRIMRPVADQIAREFPQVPALALLAQSALESGYKVPPGNSFFGVTAGTSWRGPVVDLATHEVIQGRRVGMVRAFRAYASALEAARDWARLVTSGRYKAGTTAAAGDPARFLEALAAAGYATAPNYRAVLLGMLRGLPGKLAKLGTSSAISAAPLLLAAAAVFF